MYKTLSLSLISDRPDFKPIMGIANEHISEKGLLI
jgi:hypothetical protein